MSDHPIPSAATSEPTPSTSAEDRKAAAALSSLNTTEITSEPAADSGTKQPSSADQEALGKAMSRLEIAAGGQKGTTKSVKSDGTGVVEVKKKAAVVKISGEDVGLLVNELDLSRVKATELLRANEGDARKAIRAFIRPPTASTVRA